jgi:hypothetical protein
VVLRGYSAPPQATPTASATPTLDPGLKFTCSNWCQPGSQNGLWRQTITANRPVADWNGYINLVLHDFVSETSTTAVFEAPAGASVRVEALHGGGWITACKGFVLCEP